MNLTQANYDAQSENLFCAAQQRDFLTGLQATRNASSQPIRNFLLRPTADRSDLLAVIKAEGRV
ncbi:MAG: hypothetical protein O2960_25455 [Verrucomicrobia bacterium]|nr:hypothetical protein [Verrucomicrobiota bacterium]